MNQRTIVISGGLGNLGWKLASHLVTRPGYRRLVLLDLFEPDPQRSAALRRLAAEQVDATPAQVDFVRCDLADADDGRWRTALEEADAVVHFAAQNPYPEAGWGDSAGSIDITLNVALAAAASKRCSRMVFATSNHVMGRYKDAPLADAVGPGELDTAVEAGVGTVWHTGVVAMDSTPYAVAKFAGERICNALAQQSGGATEFVCIRIGWCQPGENLPATLSASGSPTLQGDATDLNPEDVARNERWYREMWLSNRDFVHLFERAVIADSTDWPAPCIIVNGMSDNRGMKWSLAATRRLLGYEPVDDVFGD